jgi:hypothetical protein
METRIGQKGHLTIYRDFFLDSLTRTVRVGFIYSAKSNRSDGLAPSFDLCARIDGFLRFVRRTNSAERWPMRLWTWMRFLPWVREQLVTEGAARRGRRRPRRLPSRPEPRFRPQLEALEDRCVPTTWTVTNSADNGLPDTLRYDIDHAKSGDIIQFDFTLFSSIVLNPSRGQLLLNKNLTINGKGTPSGRLTIHGATPLFGPTESRVFEVSAGVSVTLDNLSLTNGNGTTGGGSGTKSFDGHGGAVLDLGTLTMNACSVEANSASVAGGGIYVAEGAHLTVNSGLVLNNSVSDSFRGAGGGIYDAGGTATISHCNVKYNSARNGGGIFDAFGTVTVSTSILAANAADDGGGIFDAFGTVTVSSSYPNSCIVKDNTASQYGGGVFNTGGKVTIRRGTLENNSADEGGGIYTRLTLGTVTVSDGSTLNNNSAHSSGGAIYDADGTATVSGSTLKNNTASTDGGGVFNSGGAVMVSNGSSLSGNSAVNGGGILTLTGKVTVSNSTLGGNTAARMGGGIYDASGGTVTINGGTLENNSAQLGGGIWIRGIVTVSDSTLSRNRASVNGGGISNDGAVTIRGSTLSHNTATQNGGGVFNSFGAVTVSKGSTVSGNAAARGGGIYTYFGPVTVSNSTLSSNSASERGGGVFNRGTLMLNTATLSGNSANDGGGVYNSRHSSTMTVNDSALSANTAARDGGGIYNSAGTVLVINSSIIGGSTTGTGIGNIAGASGGGIYSTGGGKVTVSASSVTANTATTGYGGGVYYTTANGGSLSGSAHVTGNSAPSNPTSNNTYVG